MSNPTYLCATCKWEGDDPIFWIDAPPVTCPECGEPVGTARPAPVSHQEPRESQAGHSARPTGDGGVWGSYVEYLERLEDPGWHDFLALADRWLEKYPEGTIVDHPFPRAVREARRLYVVLGKPDSQAGA